MAIQLSVAVRNARLDQVEVIAGTACKLRLLSGALEANCAAADTGTLLCEIILPSDWMNVAAAGQKTLLGSWTGAGIGGGGTIAHFRLKDSTGATCHVQGTVGVGSGDMSVDNNVIANGQTVTVNSFTLTDGNA